MVIDKKAHEARLRRLIARANGTRKSFRKC